MIITKTPFRVSLFGGSTDYPSFYEKHGSKLIGFTIDKYSYVSVRNNPDIFPYKTKVSYSKIEIVENNEQIENNGVRGTLKYFGMKDGLEIHTFADLPARTGIGSSSSFVVGLVNAISKTLYGTNGDKGYLADAAINIERYLLGEPGGIQDQIFAAYGGFISITISKNGEYIVRPLPISQDFRSNLLSNSFLVYTGSDRDSFDIARSSEGGEEAKLLINKIAHEAYDAFVSEDIELIGHLLDKSWRAKKSVSSKISNNKIDEMYCSLKNDGMIGGKLLGSGGSGFIYGVCSPYALKKIKKKYDTIDFNISDKGSEIIYEHK